MLSIFKWGGHWRWGGDEETARFLGGRAREGYSLYQSTGEWGEQVDGEKWGSYHGHGSYHKGKSLLVITWKKAIQKLVSTKLLHCFSIKLSPISSFPCDKMHDHDKIPILLCWACIKSRVWSWNDWSYLRLNWLSLIKR